MFVSQSLHVGERGIGYLDVAVSANKGRKKTDIQFQALKTPRRNEILQKSKNVPYKNLSKLAYFDLAFMADKGQHLVLNLRNT